MFIVAPPWNRTKLDWLMRPAKYLTSRPQFKMISSHLPIVTYPRHALVEPAGEINILMLKNFR
jgi:hypothetical protein